ncbi:TonB-dependent receptor plug domain-containing protein [Rasiella rasia]|uniref:TonB-dependent receptor plug domain-containing protein n=1 Tax=Rasiella rasia TaxID=2744027 RepID=A0A6G6GNF2_9FLAO|nr:TonB-dependent receptor plug domain-containing protein [Rasiella rasia]QIE60082.1 TonB-dependent receptor plug domain-containing protein [Rasiella rasia]
MKSKLIWVLLLCCAFANAQKISGIVETQNSLPLEDVAIFNKNSGTHSHTNNNGEFTIDKTTVNNELYFSFLGFEPLTYQVQASDVNTTIKIVLTQSAVSLEQIVISPKVDVLNSIVNIDLENNPVKNSQEVLRKVPGLIIGQHAGGGKAEQIFLRGFDIDHGTDINLTVDGLPVNMVSHAHGQGYSDLHFLIPETLDKIEFGKGPYYAERGDFTTAGYVAFKTKDKVKNSFISQEIGDFNSFRTAGVFKLLETATSNAYVASSLNSFDGPYETPQNFNRFNVMGKYNFALQDDQRVSFLVSHFTSKWDASGQIPERAVASGLIGRFGAIDATEGGTTSRTNFLVNHAKKLSETSNLESSAYFSQYNFELFSNFTFFLEDPVNGDQIRQFEARNILGFQTAYTKDTSLFDNDFEYSAGAGVRYDDVNDVQLSRTKNRDQLLERLAFGDVDQINSFAYLKTKYTTGDFSLSPELRLDYFKFDYVNKLTETYDNKSESKVFASPKFKAVYSPNQQLQLFAKTGIGFHSNDARVVVANEGEAILPAAYGADLGIVYKVNDKLILNSALWALFLDQEFVYVGDVGIVEPSGKTRRTGIDFGARYEALNWLYLFGDINYTYARSTEELEGEDYIPLAPDLTSTGGVSIDNLGAFSGGLNYRYIKDRPANEDNSIVAAGYFVTDITANYTYKNFVFSLLIENLFDTEWNETQFATESRLFDEAEPVEEIHFTPGTPFFIRGKVTVNF